MSASAPTVSRTVASAEQAGRGAVSIVKMSSPAEALTILPLARSWHAESQYRHLPFSERKLLAQVLKSLSRKNDGATFYVMWRGGPVGIIDLAVGEAWLCDGGRYATCLSWFVRPDVRPSLLGGRVAKVLLEQAKTWALESGSAGLFLNGTHGRRNSLERRGIVMGSNVHIALGTRS